ncbi:MAG: HD domain-containing protein [Candidatus Micrarchaeaceae archaeon]
MYIRDPIYGNVEISDTELKIIESAQMQRLRYIKQTGFAYLVFPGANHTRFEHSLGTMQATKELAENLHWEENEFSYAALLHDIGHGPFSHQSEPLLKKYLKKTHEDLGREIINNSGISDIIADSGASLKKVMDCICGAGTCDIISGALGSDRIDYLLRDSYYTGVAYGVIDFPRIKSKVTKHGGRIAIYEQGISAAESLLLARYFMFENVYMHHAQLIAGEMFAKAASSAIENGDIDPELFAHMSDEEALIALSRIKGSASLIGRIRQRRLFKRVFNGPLGCRGKLCKEEIENALSRAGIRDENYILATYDMKWPKDDIAVVDRNNKYMGMLGNLSPLVGTLAGAQGKKTVLIVAAEPKSVERARRAIERYTSSKNADI